MRNLTYILLGIAVIVLGWYVHQSFKCEQQGGVYVRTLFSAKCLEIRK